MREKMAVEQDGDNDGEVEQIPTREQNRETPRNVFDVGKGNNAGRMTHCCGRSKDCHCMPPTK